MLGCTLIYTNGLLSNTDKMKLNKCPVPTTTLLLGQKRKRGRPQNNTATLIMRPREVYSQAASLCCNSSSSSESFIRINCSQWRQFMFNTVGL
jgi:hypothetical protein